MKMSRLFMVGGLCSLFTLIQTSPVSAQTHYGWGGGNGSGAYDNSGWGPRARFGGYNRGWEAPVRWNAQQDVLFSGQAGSVPYVISLEGPAPQDVPRHDSPGEGLAGPVGPRGPRHEFGPQGPGQGWGFGRGPQGPGQGRGFGMGPLGPRREAGPAPERPGRMGRQGEGPGFGGPSHEGGPRADGQGRGFGMGPQGPRHEGGPGMGMGMGMRGQGFGGPGPEGEPTVGPRPGQRIIQMLERQNPEIAAKVRERVQAGEPPREVINDVLQRMAASENPENKAIAQRLQARLEQARPLEEGVEPRPGMRMRMQGRAEGHGEIRPERRILQALERQNPEIAAKARERLQAGKPPRSVFNNVLDELAESDNPENKAFAERVRQHLQQVRPFNEEIEPRPGVRMRLQQQVEGDGEGRQERRIRIMEHRGPEGFDGPQGPETRETDIREFRLFRNGAGNITAQIEMLERSLETLNERVKDLKAALKDLRNEVKQKDEGDRDEKIEKKGKDKDSDSDDDDDDDEDDKD